MANKVKYGLKNVYYAVATIGSDGSATYADPVQWPGAVSLSLDAQGDSSAFRADNVNYYTTQSNAGYSGDFESALIPDSFRKSILGDVVDQTTGIQLENVGAPTKEFALLFQFEGDESSIRHVLYNCTCSRPAISGETTDTSVTPKTETVSLTAASIYNAALDKDIAHGKCDSTAAAYSTWFSAVKQPTSGS